MKQEKENQQQQHYYSEEEDIEIAPLGITTTTTTAAAAAVATASSTGNSSDSGICFWNSSGNTTDTYTESDIQTNDENNINVNNNNKIIQLKNRKSWNHMKHYLYHLIISFWPTLLIYSLMSSGVICLIVQVSLNENFQIDPFYDIVTIVTFSVILLWFVVPIYYVIYVYNSLRKYEGIYELVSLTTTTTSSIDPSNNNSSSDTYASNRNDPINSLPSGNDTSTTVPVGYTNNCTNDIENTESSVPSGSDSNTNNNNNINNVIISSKNIHYTMIIQFLDVWEVCEHSKFAVSRYNVQCIVNTINKNSYNSNNDNNINMNIDGNTGTKGNTTCTTTGTSSDNTSRGCNCKNDIIVTSIMFLTIFPESGTETVSFQNTTMHTHNSTNTAATTKDNCNHDCNSNNNNQDPTTVTDSTCTTGSKNNNITTTDSENNNQDDNAYADTVLPPVLEQLQQQQTTVNQNVNLSYQFENQNQNQNQKQDLLEHFIQHIFGCTVSTKNNNVNVTNNSNYDNSNIDSSIVTTRTNSFFSVVPKPASTTIATLSSSITNRFCRNKRMLYFTMEVLADRSTPTVSDIATINDQEPQHEIVDKEDIDLQILEQEHKPQCKEYRHETAEEEQKDVEELEIDFQMPEQDIHLPVDKEQYIIIEEEIDVDFHMLQQNQDVTKEEHKVQEEEAEIDLQMLEQNQQLQQQNAIAAQQNHHNNNNNNNVTMTIVTEKMVWKRI